MPATQTVHYGPHPAQLAELSRPEGPPRGVAVVVHGGFWKPEYGLEYARPLVPSLAAAGWLAWAIEYRRGTGRRWRSATRPAATWPCGRPGSTSA